jgi:hypothetical protein
MILGKETKNTFNLGTEIKDLRKIFLLNATEYFLITQTPFRNYNVLLQQHFPVGDTPTLAFEHLKTY